jgi:glycosyltransferase involved in cell wall biosynthesis
MTVSVLILTLNEEVNIEACLASARWSDDIVVLDSGSTDRTVELATTAGARVVTRPFDNYAAQRNFGLQQIPWRNPWVLMLDADEVVSPELARELAARVASAPASLCLLRFRRKDFFFGTWIRGSGGYPSWFPRLARVGRCWVEREFNEQYETDGETGELQEHLHHFPFNKGLTAWIDKHNRYSSMEAELIYRGLSEHDRPGVRGLFSADPLVRRRAMKQGLYSLPARPLVVFCGLYFIKLGFLEGRAGLTFSVLRAWYEFLVNTKVRELRRRAARLPV